MPGSECGFPQARAILRADLSRGAGTIRLSVECHKRTFTSSALTKRKTPRSSESVNHWAKLRPAPFIRAGQIHRL
jgi:hypothetical protein